MPPATRPLQSGVRGWRAEFWLFPLKSGAFNAVRLRTALINRPRGPGRRATFTLRARATQARPSVARPPAGADTRSASSISASAPARAPTPGSDASAARTSCASARGAGARSRSGQPTLPRAAGRAPACGRAARVRAPRLPRDRVGRGISVIVAVDRTGGAALECAGTASTRARPKSRDASRRQARARRLVR